MIECPKPQLRLCGAAGVDARFVPIHTVEGLTEHHHEYVYAINNPVWLNAPPLTIYTIVCDSNKLISWYTMVSIVDYEHEHTWWF